MAVLDDLIVQLQTEGVGTLNVDIFASTAASIPMLASGFATVHLIETGGTAPDITQNDVTLPAYHQPAVQVTARADTYAAARAKASAAYAALVKVRNQTVNGVWYLWIKPLQNPFDGGPDARKQARVQFNVITRKKE